MKIKFINRNVSGTTVDFEMDFSKIEEHLEISTGYKGRTFAKATSERVAVILSKRATPLTFNPDILERQWEVELEEAVSHDD